MRFRRVSYPLSATLSIIAVLLFVFVHMNFGIDFRRRTVIELRRQGRIAEVGTLRTLAEKLNLGEIEVQAFGNKSTRPCALPATRRRRRAAGGGGARARGGRKRL